MRRTPTALAVSDGYTDTLEPRMSGVVLWFDTAKGFGFIAPDEQPGEYSSSTPASTCMATAPWPSISR
ncbi:cold shock domain-containing protein [Nocardia sp. CA-151230]|uniref:cold shock domain-containing protein n=1 Tax=Nocardia sp. CA-151230 TaxID=3239982 RepID=UPI003D8E7432